MQVPLIVCLTSFNTLLADGDSADLSSPDKAGRKYVNTICDLIVLFDKKKKSIYLTFQRIIVLH